RSNQVVGAEGREILALHADSRVAAFERRVGTSDRPHELELGSLEMTKHRGVVNSSGRVGVHKADAALPDKWLHRSPRQRAAVGNIRLAGDERSVARREKERQSADLLRLSDAGQRLRGFELPPVLFVLPEVFGEVRSDETRRDRVDADVMFA